MACITKANKNNFIRLNKVTGGLTLSALQASGLPSVCNNVNPTPSLTITSNFDGTSTNFELPITGTGSFTWILPDGSEESFTISASTYTLTINSGGVMDGSTRTLVLESDSDLPNITTISWDGKNINRS